MRFSGYSFGSVRVDGVAYDHDLIIDRGKIRKRKKGPSRQFRGAYGHTPLSAAEDIPWRHATGRPVLLAGRLRRHTPPTEPGIRQASSAYSVISDREACLPGRIPVAEPSRLAGSGGVPVLEAERGSHKLTSDPQVDQ